MERKDSEPCCDQVVGVDKAWSEAVADAEGVFHGTNLGKTLSNETEKRNSHGKLWGSAFEKISSASSPFSECCMDSILAHCLLDGPHVSHDF